MDLCCAFCAGRTRAGHRASAPPLRPARAWVERFSQIVFELDHPSGEPFCSIELINADGSGTADLTGPTNGCEAQPSFTPNGQRIVFERYDDQTNVDAIWSMNIAGADRH